MGSRTACILTFGCRMNHADSAVIRERLTAAGYTLGDDPDTADLVVLNTCSVRDHAEARVRGRLGRLGRRRATDAGFRLVVTGCMAQRLGEALRQQFPQIDLVVGTGRFPDLADLLAAVERTGPLTAAEAPGDCDPGWAAGEGSVNADIPVMRGCDRHCTYCVVPAVRGRGRSRAPEEILADTHRAVASGRSQVTLLGQTVDAYGRDRDDGACLARLLHLLQEVPGLMRIRFVTSHPVDIGDDLLAAIAALPKVARHLHVPAQSGSSSILRRMGRGYDRAGYLDLVARARAAVPDLELQSDFIVGFPGETAEDFAATADLIATVRFGGCFVFAYDPRPGTPAARLADDVPAEEKQRRVNHLLALQRRIQAEDHRTMHGRVLQVLVEGPSRRSPATLAGRSEGNRNVVIPAAGNAGLVGRLVPVCIERSTGLTLFGRPVTPVDPGPAMVQR
jgi:tRNA-2-methylthio-N6-dimethylallyladenosine synthase